MVNFTSSSFYCHPKKQPQVVKDQRSIEEATGKIQFFCANYKKLWTTDTTFCLDFLLGQLFGKSSYKVLSMLASMYLQYTVRRLVQRKDMYGEPTNTIALTPENLIDRLYRLIKTWDPIALGSLVYPTCTPLSFALNCQTLMQISLVKHITKTGWPTGFGKKIEKAFAQEKVSKDEFDVDLDNHKRVYLHKRDPVPTKYRKIHAININEVNGVRQIFFQIRLPHEDESRTTWYGLDCMELSVPHMVYLIDQMNGPKQKDVLLCTLWLDGTDPKTISEKDFSHSFLLQYYRIWDHTPQNDRLAIWIGGLNLPK